MALVETSSLGIGSLLWWMTGLLGLAVAALLGLGWSLQETPESARFSRVAPIAVVRWVLFAGGGGGVDGLVEEVESAGGDEVARGGVGCREGVVVVVVQVSLDFPSASA
jgi:hypothetical protein